jgi:hypothetical protein
MGNLCSAKSTEAASVFSNDFRRDTIDGESDIGMRNPIYYMIYTIE